MSQPKFTVGSDAEFFLYHSSTGLVPATGFNCAGTKLEPVSLGELGTYHRDNISVELQPPPADTPEKFIQHGSQLYRALRIQFGNMSLDLGAIPAAEFSTSMLRGIEEASEMGCEPDKCAYSGETQATIKPEAMGGWRTTSGHLHVGGIDDLNEDQRRQIVQWLDILEGLTGKQKEAQSDRLAWHRRAYYGQAGRYRMKPYGLEWRTPSSLMWRHWLQPQSAASLFASIGTAIALVRAGVYVESIASDIAVKRVRDAIDGRSLSNVTRRVHYWQDRLYEYDTIKSIIKKVGTQYDYRASLYSTGD